MYDSMIIMKNQACQDHFSCFGAHRLLFPKGIQRGARHRPAQDRRNILRATARNRPCTGHDEDSEQ